MKRSCKDCRYYRPTDIQYRTLTDTGKCVAPQVHHIKVEAIRRLPWHYASMLRAYGWFTAWRAGFCGKRGRWWEPRAALRPGSNPPPPDMSRKPLAPSGAPPRRNDFGFPITEGDTMGSGCVPRAMPSVPAPPNPPPIIRQPKGRPIP